MSGIARRTMVGALAVSLALAGGVAAAASPAAASSQASHSSGTATAVRAAVSYGELVRWWASDLVDHVAPEMTVYEGSTADMVYPRWPGVRGATAYESRTNCNGFVVSVIAQALGTTPDQFKAWMGSEVPGPRRFVDAITARNGFESITRVTDVAAGDVFAINYPDDGPGDGANTGHVVIISSAPVAQATAGPGPAGTTRYVMRVLDSTKDFHGISDTRAPKDAIAQRTGAGAGNMSLFADSAGTLVGYAWSDSSGSTYWPAATRPFAVGRFTPETPATVPNVPGPLGGPGTPGPGVPGPDVPGPGVPGPGGTPGKVRALKVHGTPAAKIRTITWRPPATTGVTSTSGPVKVAFYRVRITAKVGGKTRVLLAKTIKAPVRFTTRIKLKVKRTKLSRGRNTVTVRAVNTANITGPAARLRFEVTKR